MKDQTTQSVSIVKKPKNSATVIYGIRHNHTTIIPERDAYRLDDEKGIP